MFISGVIKESLLRPWDHELYLLTRLFPVHFSLPPENIGKPQGFRMFSVGKEKVHWEQMD